MQSSSSKMSCLWFLLIDCKHTISRNITVSVKRMCLSFQSISIYDWDIISKFPIKIERLCYYYFQIKISLTHLEKIIPDLKILNNDLIKQYFLMLMSLFFVVSVTFPEVEPFKCIKCETFVYILQSKFCHGVFNHWRTATALLRILTEKKNPKIKLQHLRKDTASIYFVENRNLALELRIISIEIFLKYWSTTFQSI